MVTDSRRLAGVAGLVSFAFSLTVLPLYFVHSGAPPDSNVLTRILLGSLGLISLLVFSAAWGQIITDTASDRPWLSAATTTPLVILIGLTFVHFSFEAGTVIATLGPVDPTREGVLAPAQFLLQGALGRLLSLAFLAGSAIAIMIAGFLPRWLARAAVVAAVVQACFVPSMYFAPNPSDFYGAVGWGATALAPSFLVAWILLASLTLVRGGVRHPSKNSTAKPPALARNSSAQ